MPATFIRVWTANLEHEVGMFSFAVGQTIRESEQAWDDDDHDEQLIEATLANTPNTEALARFEAIRPMLRSKLRMATPKQVKVCFQVPYLMRNA